MLRQRRTEMWIVRLALNRPYTFIVASILILVLGFSSIATTPTDIFPNIDIPVVTVIWSYSGLPAKEMEQRVTTFSEFVMAVVNDVKSIDSQTVSGASVIKISFQPQVHIDAAMSQVGAAVNSIRFRMPPGVNPPWILRFSASTVPVIQLSLSSDTLSESEIYDYGLFRVRQQLTTVPGTLLPTPYGGVARQIMVDLDQNALLAKGLTPIDVTAAINAQNVTLPSGTAKVDSREYTVSTNSSPIDALTLNDVPIKTVNGSLVYMRDVAHVRDGWSVQQNVARSNGKPAALLTIMKTGSVSTLDIVNQIKNDVLPASRAAAPKGLKITELFDQSIFVKASIVGVLREGVIAASLTALMILLFLGSWRSTVIIAVSIPLSILSSIIVLSLLGETINIMTLGGLALAVGILVDDATVTIENIERYREEGHGEREAILDGAAQIAVPALVSTLCICIVFLPMFLLGGVARYLFVPLAEAVIFAMVASYLLSRTLVPTMARYLLAAPVEGAAPSRNLLARGQQAFERGFERVRLAYRGLLTRLIDRRVVFIPVFLAACLVAFLLVPRLGENFFPDTDSGQFTLHLRAQTGTRIEETARLTDLVEAAIRREIPAAEMDVILDNIGLPYSVINWMHSASGVIGAADADILVSLKADHRPTAGHVRALRQKLPEVFHGVTFYFLPADIVTQIINFGLPAPIDIQIEGADIQGNRRVAEQMLKELRQVPGLVDLRIQQRFDYPKFDVTVDRTKAGQGGFT